MNKMPDAIQFILFPPGFHIAGPEIEKALIRTFGPLIYPKAVTVEIDSNKDLY